MQTLITNTGFDPIAWASQKENGNKSINENPVSVQPAMPADDEVRDLVEAIVANGVDITEGYGNWFMVAAALSESQGEGGRGLFHRLSQMNAEYNPKECDGQYDKCLKSGRRGITISTLFYMAGEAGVNLNGLTREHKSSDFCKVCKDANPCANNDVNRNSLIINDDSVSECSEKPLQTLQTLQNSQTPDVDDTQSGHTFYDKIPKEKWCSFLAPVIESMDYDEGKDKMLLNSLVILSGMIPNYYARYGNSSTIYPMLYLITYGQSASRKGEIASCLRILQPLKNEIETAYQKELEEYRNAHSEWEAKGKEKATRGPEPREPFHHSPLIPVNNTSSAFYRSLKANDGWGIMFETEASVLTKMKGSDFGDYTDALLKAFHHELLSMSRVNENTYIEIDNPRLAVAMTCTPGQLPMLFPTLEDGFGNRFLFYRLRQNFGWNSPFKQTEKTLNEVYEDLGKEALVLYHEMKKLGDRNIQFSFTQEQQKRFNVFFEAELNERFFKQGDGIVSFIYRLGLSAFRIAMVLAMLRRFSEWKRMNPLFADNEQVLVCSDTDFNIMLTMIKVLIEQASEVYSMLSAYDRSSQLINGKNFSGNERALFDALGDEFTSQDVKTISSRLNIKEGTGRHYLDNYFNKYHLVDRLMNGHYRKKSAKTKDENRKDMSNELKR